MHNAVQDFSAAESGRGTLVVTLILVLLFNFGLIYLYKRWQSNRNKTEMEVNVQKHVGAYFQMRESNPDQM